MRRKIVVVIAPESDPKKETARIELHLSHPHGVAGLDINGAALLKISRAVPDIAQDFLCIAACIYGADKAVARSSADDKWTRHMAIEIPVEHVNSWTKVANDLSECVGFLTGDIWEISFRHAEKRLVQPKRRMRSIPYKKPSGNAVCLFSGGLDSFIGAIDWLAENQDSRLLLVGHYDRAVSGPKTDQGALHAACQRTFGRRFELAQIQVGLSSGMADTNFRSRSLLFIALGCYFAEILGKGVPVLIPENGPIALNFPLTVARRGSCSTRTVHPHFVATLNKILSSVGVKNLVSNPYALKTKGEMVSECKDQNLLNNAYDLSRSCAKANHRESWVNRKARACGVCIPCLFRRAALHCNGRDDEPYGKKIETIKSLASTPVDVLALVAFLKGKLSDREIASRLLANGPLSMDHLHEYVTLVKGMRDEMLVWLRAKGSAYLIKQVRLC